MKHELLPSISYFSGLDEATVKALARVAVRRRYDAGQMIFIERDDLEVWGKIIARFYSIEGVKGHRHSHRQSGVVIRGLSLVCGTEGY